MLFPALHPMVGDSIYALREWTEYVSLSLGLRRMS